jgi:uncharacterized protein (TIGR02145 family)
MPKASRKNDFENTYSFTYIFTGTRSDYTELTYEYADGSSIVSGVTGDGTTTCTLTFDSGVIEKAKKKTKDEALKVTLYALFKVGGGDTWYKESLEISIQDCVCGCPAKVDNGWLNFQCHNLGGEDIYPGVPIERKHHGNWYRFGAKTFSMENTPDHDSNNKWDNEEYQSTGTEWSTDNNPCPSGYRLPTIAEWTQVIDQDNNTQSNIGTFTSNSFTAGKKFGDYLVLPAAGNRNNDSGALVARGYSGTYWSSSSNVGGVYTMSLNSGSPYNGSTNRDYGFSVRCVLGD